MVNNDKWTFRLWKDIIDTQLSSWLMYIPGMSGREEMKEVKEFKSNQFHFFFQVIILTPLTHL